MKFKKRYYVIAIAFYLIAVFLYVSFQYYNTKHELYRQIDAKLKNAALTMPQVLPIGFHHSGLNAHSISKMQDWQLIHRLSRQSELMHTKFIYSLIQHNGVIRFTACSSNKEELKEHKEVHYFDPYDDAPQGLKDAFVTEQIHYDEYTDQWGEFRSVFIPMKTKEGYPYIVGADVEISFIQSILKEELYKSIFEVLYHILILLPIFLLYRHQLKQINADLESTIQKRTAQLQQSETKFRDMFAYHSAPMLLIDPESGKILDANHAASVFYSYPHDNLIKMEISQINTLSEDELRIQRLSALNQSKNTFIFNHRLANGDIRIVEVHSSPVSTEKNAALFSIIFDITEQVHSQELLLESKKLAEASAQAKSEFLATMSHEIRTPMNGVLGMISLLERSQLDATQRHQLSVAKGSATSLLSLINDILDFSKIEAGKLDLEILPFDLKQELSSFTELMAFKAEEKHLHLTLDTIQIEHSSILADPSRLRQILTNLVGNAIKFTANGSIQIHARLNVQENDKARLIIDIIDSGIGIPSDKINSLFDPFTQADGSTTRKYGGTGLGLSIVKRLCQLMNGTVYVSSVPNQGSTFTIDIEVTLTDEANILSSNDSSTSMLISADIEWPLQTRILLVEDNPTNQIVAQAMLDELGLSADIAANGIEAIEALKLSITLLPYTVVLMDCQMPEMDGYEATKAIRAGKAGEKNRKIPIIAMTANAMQGDREKCVQSGMDDYLAKPINLHELKSMLIKWLFPSQLQEEKKIIVPTHVPDDETQSPLWDKEGALQRLGGKEKYLKLIVSSFLDESPKLMSMLEQAISDHDFPSIQLHAHSMKGSAANVGALRLQEIAKAVEFGAKDQQLQTVQNLFPEFKQIYDETIPLLA